MNAKRVLYTVFVILMALQILFPAPLFADAIGKFTDMRGDVSLTRAKKTTTPKAGDVVQAKDIITTGDNARVKLLLSDDTLLSVGQNSNIEITEFLLDKNKRSGVVSLKAGAMHTQVEKFLTPGSKFEVHTPNAVAGARGTAWLTLVQIAAQNVAQSSIYALQQSVFVANAALPAQAVTVVAGNFTVVAGAALPTAAGAFSAATIAPIMGQMGVAMPGLGAVGAPIGAAAQPGATSAAGAAAGTAGTAAGTAAGAGIGVGTAAIGAAVVGAALGVVGATAGSSDTTTTHTTTSHH